MNINIFQPLAIHELGKRNNQEDSIYPALGEADDNCRLFILCDGMGGHEHGEVASQTISRQIAAYLHRSLQPGEPLSDETLTSALRYAWDQLDSLSNPESAKRMGTTLTLLYFGSRGCTAAHIGDSRIYHIRPAEHRILYKSRDHSLVYDLYQAGEIAYEEMATSPKKNIITRAIVACEENRAKPDIIHITDIKPGDVFYICSDGMLEQMDDDQLVGLFASEGSDEEKRATLISDTADNSDNHSAYLVRIKDVEYSEEDTLLVDEEPTARCNALNIKPIAVRQMPPQTDAPVVEMAEIAQPVDVTPLPDAAYAQQQMYGGANPGGGNSQYAGTAQMPKKQNSKKGIYIILALLVAIVALALLIWALFKSGRVSVIHKEVKIEVIQSHPAQSDGADESDDEASFDDGLDGEAAAEAAGAAAQKLDAPAGTLKNADKNNKANKAADKKTGNDGKVNKTGNDNKTAPAAENKATAKPEPSGQNTSAAQATAPTPGKNKPANGKTKLDEALKSARQKQ